MSHKYAYFSIIFVDNNNVAVLRQPARGQTLLSKAINSGSPTSSEMLVIGVLSKCSFVVDKIDVVSIKV